MFIPPSPTSDPSVAILREQIIQKVKQSEFSDIANWLSQELEKLNQKSFDAASFLVDYVYNIVQKEQYSAQMDDLKIKTMVKKWEYASRSVPAYGETKTIANSMMEDIAQCVQLAQVIHGDQEALHFPPIFWKLLEKIDSSWLASSRLLELSPQARRIKIYICTMRMTQSIEENNFSAENIVQMIRANLNIMSDLEKIYYLNMIYAQENKPLAELLTQYHKDNDKSELYGLLRYIKEISDYPHLLAITREGNDKGNGITYKKIIERMREIKNMLWPVLPQDRSMLFLYIEETLRAVSRKHNEKKFYLHYFREKSIITIGFLRVASTIQEAQAHIVALEALRKEFGTQESAEVFGKTAYLALKNALCENQKLTNMAKKNIIIELKRFPLFRSNQNALMPLLDLPMENIDELDLLELFFELKHLLSRNFSLDQLLADDRFTQAWER